MGDKLNDQIGKKRKGTATSTQVLLHVSEGANPDSVKE